MTLYAGETVVWVVDHVDNDGRVSVEAPDNGITIQVTNTAEDTTHQAEVAMTLQEEDSGTVDSATKSTLEDTSKNWEKNEHEDAVVEITNGTGAGQARRIKKNTSTELTIYDTWKTQPDATSTYQIHRGEYRYEWGSPDTLSGEIVRGIARAKDSSWPKPSIEKEDIRLE